MTPGGPGGGFAELVAADYRLRRLSEDHQVNPELARGDIDRLPPKPSHHGHPRDVRVLPRSRDFH